MKRATLFSAIVTLLASCATTDPNEGIFIHNGVEYPKLSEDRLQKIRSTWSSTSQPISESTKAGRQIAYWILDVIAHHESESDSKCNSLDLLEIKKREVGLMLPLKTGPNETQFLRPATFHEAWIVNACGKRHEWRVLDDLANPQNPLRVFRSSAA
jgi:hypothetical protein